MAEEKDPILGVSVTIKGDEIKKGADLFLQQIDRMEKASEKAGAMMDKSFQSLNLQLAKINEQLEFAEARLRMLASLSSQTGNNVNNEQVQSLLKQVEQLTKERNSLMAQAKSNGNNASSSGEKSTSKDGITAIKKQVSDAKKEVKNLQSELNKLYKDYDKVDEKIAKANEKARTASNGTDRHKYEKVVKDAEAERDSISHKIERLVPAVEEAENNLNQLNDTMETMGQKSESLRTKINELRKSMTELDKSSPEYKEKAKEARELQEQLKSINDDTSQQSTLLTQLMGGMNNYEQILSMLPSSLKDGVEQMNQLIKVGLKFIATPIGAIITAIVLAMKALMAYFNNTAEGQEFLAKKTAYLQGILQSLMGVLIGLGKAIMNVGTLFAGMWDAMTGKGTDKWNEAIKGFKEAGNMIANAVTGATALGDAFERAAEMAMRVEDSMSRWQNEKTVHLANIASAQAILNSSSSTDAQKIAAQATIAREQKLIADREFSDKSLLLEAALTKSGKADSVDRSKLKRGGYSADDLLDMGYTKADAEEIISMQRELSEQEIQNMTQARDNAEKMKNLRVQQINSEREYAESLLAIKRDFSRQEQDLEDQRENLALQALNDSVDKRLQVRKAAYDKELTQIRKTKEDAILQAKELARSEYGDEQSLRGRSINPLVYADLSNEEETKLNLTASEKVIRNRYKARVSIATQQADISTEAATRSYNDVNDLLDKYQDYTEKKLQLDIQYGEDRERIMRAIAQQESVINDESLDDAKRANARNLKARLDGLLEERKSQYKKDTDNLNSEGAKSKIDVLKSNSAYMLAMQNVRRVSTDALQTLLKQLEQVQSEVAKLDPEKAEAVARLMESINQELIERNPFEGIKKQIKEITALNKEKKTLQEIAKNGGGIYNGEVMTLQEAESKLVEIDGRLVVAHENYQTALVKGTEQLNRVFSQLGDIGSKIGGKWGNAISGVASFGSSMLNYKQNFSESAMKANGMMDANGKMTTMGKASTYLAAAQAAYESSMLVASIIPRKSAQKEYEKYAKRQAEVNNLTQSIMSYRLAALEAQKADKAWFGNDSLGRLRDAWEVASQAKDQYFTKLREQQETYHNKDKDDNWSGIVANSVVGAVTGAVIGAVAGGPWGMIAGAAIGAAVGTTAGIVTNNLATDYDSSKSSAQDNLRIETKKRKKSFLGIGGHDQQTEDLRTWARNKYNDELFDAEGWINTELAQQILNDYGDKLQGQTEETLQELIELKEKYDEYQDSLKEYVSSLYEPLVDNMIDSLWEWFDSGKDALASFKESASQTFRSIVSDMMRTIALKQVFAGFEDNIKDLYDKYFNGQMDEETLMNGIMRETGDLFDRYETTVPILEKTMTTIADMAKEKDIDLSLPSSSSASKGSFSSMSQDTGNEMNGRLTAIQIQGETIIGQLTMQTVTQTSLLANSSLAMGYISEIRDIQLTSVEYLRKIQLSTNELYQINQRLENIDKNTSKL